MNNNIVLKEFENNQVEIVVKDNEPLFELYSTGMALGYARPNSIGKLYPRKDRIDSIVKNADIELCDLDGHTYLTEDMLYDFMLESRTEKCKKFRKWVTKEVLPDIRKHGMYATENTIENILSNPDFAITLLTKYKEEKQKKIQAEQKIKKQKPLVDFANKVGKSKNTSLVREVAKIACDEGIKIGGNRLWDKLREWGLIFKNSREPKQYGIDRGYFEVVEGVRESNGNVFTYRTTRVTGKGKLYIINRLQSELATEEVAVSK